MGNADADCHSGWDGAAAIAQLERNLNLSRRHALVNKGRGLQRGRRYKFAQLLSLIAGFGSTLICAAGL